MYSAAINSPENTNLADNEDARVPLISARRLSFSFGAAAMHKQILFNLDIDIWPGEIVLLTGPSGSGKSTLLTLIGGLRTVEQGQLTVLGHKMEGASASDLVALRRRIGFIFQTHHLLDFLTVRQNVELVFDLQPEISAAVARRRSVDMLKAVGLRNHIDQLPSKLSIGQQQRVAIARALVPLPELVLADEPTSALDSQAGRDVVELLMQLAKDHGCPILMVTHDCRVLDVADRVLRMEDGRMCPPSDRP